MQIEIYSKDNCPYCVKAKYLLEQQGLEYTEKKLGVDVTREELLAIAPNAKTVPQIIINENVIGGYDQLETYFKESI